MACIDTHSSRSLRKRIPCSMLSKAFVKSNRIATLWLVSDPLLRESCQTWRYEVSVECFFLFPFWCSVKQFWRVAYSVNWMRAARSQILDRAGNRDTGRLLLATSWSPSFNIGITTDSFQADGKTDVKTFIIWNITCRFGTKALNVFSMILAREVHVLISSRVESYKTIFGHLTLCKGKVRCS